MRLFKQKLLAAALLATAAVQAHAWGTVITTLPDQAYTTNLANQNVTTFAPVASDGVLVEFNIRFDVGSAINNSDHFSVWIDNGTTAAGDSFHTQAVNFGLRGQGSGVLDFFASLGSPNAPMYTPPNAVVGTTYSVLGFIGQSTQTSYNWIKFWIDPTAVERANLTTPDLTFSVPLGSFTQLSRFGVRASGLDAGDSVSISNFTVTQVPEPSSVALAFVGMGILGMAARRRRKAD